MRLVASLASILLLCGCVDPNRVGPPSTTGLRGVWENDTHSNTDAQYTNGIRVGADAGIVSRPVRGAMHRAGKWGQRWAGTPDCDAVIRVGLHCLSSFAGITQTMYTPTDREIIVRDTTDRPYAGLLVQSYSVRRQSPSDVTQLELTLGVLGPSSKGEWTQSAIHKHVTNTGRFKGWNHQIPDQPAINLLVRRRRRFEQALGRGFSADATPTLGGMLGTAFTYANTSGQLRIGYGLTPEWGGERISPTRLIQLVDSTKRTGLRDKDAVRTVRALAMPARRGFELGVLVEGESRLVLRNATLDDTPRGATEPWVTRRPFVREWAVGGFARWDMATQLASLESPPPFLACLARSIGDVSFSYRRMRRSSEFRGPYVRGNDRGHTFSIVALSISPPLSLP